MDENSRVVVGMGGISFESSEAQAGHAFGFKCAGKIIWQIPSPNDRAIFQSDIIGAADAETGSVVRFNRFEHPGWTIIKNPAFVFRPAIQLHAHVFESHVSDGAVRRAINADAVLGMAGDVLNLNVAQ